MKKVFNFYSPGERADQRRIAYFGWEGKDFQGLYNYITGYKEACELIYQRFYEAALEGDIASQDTLIFPLCFNYRQAIELYLKYFYRKYCAKNNDQYKHYLGEVSHELNKSWEKVKNGINELLANQNISNSLLDDIESCIHEWSDFDKMSFRMRYPMTKSNHASNETSCRLDVFGLKEGMDSFFDNIRKLDFSIDNQLIQYEYSNELICSMNDMYNKYRSMIGEALLLMAETERDRFDIWDSLENDCRILFGIMYLIATDVEQGLYRLGVEVQNRKKDFIKALILCMEDLGISFGKKNTQDEYFIDKLCYQKYDTLEKRFNLAFEIMDEI